MSWANLYSPNTHCISQYPKRSGLLYNPKFIARGRGVPRTLGFWWVNEHHIHKFYWNCPYEEEQLPGMGYRTNWYIGKVRKERHVRHSRHIHRSA